jgi:hypothetical protein
VYLDFLSGMVSVKSGRGRDLGFIRGLRECQI